jgi:hypothetical protein
MDRYYIRHGASQKELIEEILAQAKIKDIQVNRSDLRKLNPWDLRRALLNAQGIIRLTNQLAPQRPIKCLWWMKYD